MGSRPGPSVRIKNSCPSVAAPNQNLLIAASTGRLQPRSIGAALKDEQEPDVMGRSAKERRGPQPPNGHPRRRPPVLGIDVGGVLVDRVAEQSDTSFFGDRPMETPVVPGAFDAIRELLICFDNRVHIVSKAGPKIAGLTRSWLATHEVVGDSGIAIGNVHFVRKRPDKHPVCERLGITHFVDDRVDVLSHLSTVEHRYLFTGGLGHHDVPESVPVWATAVDTWPRLLSLLQQDVGQH